MKKSYKLIEHTADIGIRAYGKNPQALFVNAAAGMFEILAKRSKVGLRQKVKISLEAPGYDELLLEWLRELLYQYNTTGIVFKEFKISGLDSSHIQAEACGSKNSSIIKTEIKAVTYHKLYFKPIKMGYEAQVIFDV